jgi:hypothetical protein
MSRVIDQALIFGQFRDSLNKSMRTSLSPAGASWASLRLQRAPARLLRAVSTSV